MCVMEEKRLSEKESLELISQMLRQTKKNMEVGSGNIFLYYGYSALFISVLVFSLIYYTGNNIWALIWFMMFVPNIIIQMRNKKEASKVVTYTDKAIENTWSVVGSMFGITVLAIFAFGWYVGECNFGLMLPLSLLYAGIGTSITGVITNIKELIYALLLGFFVGIYMLVELLAGSVIIPSWHLLFGIAFIFMMIIPGHIINRKSKFQCLKN